MKRLMPKTLFGRMLGILLLGLVVSHAIGSGIYATDREQAVRAVGGFAAAQRIANLVGLIADVPRDWRERIVGGLSDPGFRVALLAQPPTPRPAEADAPVARAIGAFLQDRLALGPDRQPLVAVEPLPGIPPPFSGQHLMPPGGHGPMMHGLGGPMALLGLDVAIPLADGQWLRFVTALPKGDDVMSWQFLVSMILMVVVSSAVSVWAVRWLTRPLGALAAAADRLGADLNTPPLSEDGAVEVRQAAHAFNVMQARLKGLIENRTRMLAAISHDLRTPLTLLRLRAENVENGQDRERMLSSIADMDRLIASILAFARDEARTEPPRPTDLAALLESLVDDMADAGLPVGLAATPDSFVLSCRPEALKRALTNLIDNAVKYGKEARIALQHGPGVAIVTIDDTGPGLAAADLERVFQPFYRVEGSRNRGGGGTGLGLAIAVSVVQSHGGTLTLSNRPEGGLRATVTLPA